MMTCVVEYTIDAAKPEASERAFMRPLLPGTEPGTGAPQ
jgi:hypothetical protein